MSATNHFSNLPSFPSSPSSSSVANLKQIDITRGSGAAPGTELPNIRYAASASLSPSTVSDAVTLSTGEKIAKPDFVKEGQQKVKLASKKLRRKRAPNRNKKAKSSRRWKH
jgi:hypothetical protein